MKNPSPCLLLLLVSSALAFWPRVVHGADIVGRITLLTSRPGRLPSASVLIEGPKMSSTQIDKALVTVGTDTKIFRRALVQGNVTSLPAKLTDLQMGQMVEATFAGPVAMSYPVQASASEIVILDQGLADTGSAAVMPVFPVIKEGETVTLTGKVQGGVMALGGETTGWLMPYISAQGPKTIEVDFTTATGDKPLNGQEFKVTGKIVLKSYVERGPTLILLATKVEKASASAAATTGNITATPNAPAAVPTGTANSPYAPK